MQVQTLHSGVRVQEGIYDAKRELPNHHQRLRIMVWVMNMTFANNHHQPYRKPTCGCKTRKWRNYQQPTWNRHFGLQMTIEGRCLCLAQWKTNMLTANHIQLLSAEGMLRAVFERRWEPRLWWSDRRIWWALWVIIGENSQTPFRSSRRRLMKAGTNDTNRRSGS